MHVCEEDRVKLSDIEVHLRQPRCLAAPGIELQFHRAAIAAVTDARWKRGIICPLHAAVREATGSCTTMGNERIQGKGLSRRTLVRSNRTAAQRLRDRSTEHLKIFDTRMKNAPKSLVAAATLLTITDRPRRRARGTRAGAIDPTEAPRMKSGSWTETVYGVVIATDRLMTMDELRDAVGKVRTLEKAWISGVQRLKGLRTHRFLQVAHRYTCGSATILRGGRGWPSPGYPSRPSSLEVGCRNSCVAQGQRQGFDRT